MKFKLLSNVRRPEAKPHEPDDVQPGFGAGEIVEADEAEWHDQSHTLSVSAKPDYGTQRVLKSQLLPL